MEARYLRVKNWRDHQHYKDRRPPWIKVKRELIDGDNGREFREQLSEIEQWQLVRIWLYVSGSERVMYDVEGDEVPLVAYDEQTIRVGIRSLKRIGLDKFVRLGFLESVSAVEADASVASKRASADASAGAITDPPESGVTTPTETGRGLEGLEGITYRPVGNEIEGEVRDLDSLRAASRLFDSIPESGRDVGTQTVVLGYARELEPSDFDAIRVRLEQKLSDDSLFKNAGAYVNGALQRRAIKAAALRSEAAA